MPIPSLIFGAKKNILNTKYLLINPVKVIRELLKNLIPLLRLGSLQICIAQFLSNFFMKLKF